MSKIIRISFLITVACISVCLPCRADLKRGSVAYIKSGCNHYILVDRYDNYALVEDYGGSTPDTSEQIVGAFNGYGSKDFYNLSRDNSFRVYVEDYNLSKQSVVEKYLDKCK